MPPVLLDLSRGIAVSGDEHRAPFEAATWELTRALGPFRSSNGGPKTPLAITLRHGDATGVAGDAFTWRATRDTITIEGRGAGGVLPGVFDFLETLGFAWFAPGDAWERKPASPTIKLDNDQGQGAPALAGRSLIIGHHAFLREGEAWVAWSARNRLNNIFFHIDDHGLALGAAPGKQWRAKRDLLLPLCRSYAMTVELGGHGMPALLPRNLFVEKPQLFRMKDGARRADGNFCTANPETLLIIAANATEWFTANPGADVYHLWPDDQPNGAWCSCSECAKVTPSDQAMIATNVLAEALANVDAKAKIAFLSYHDTEDPPQSVTPGENVVMTFAPRLRTYAQPIDDKKSAVNARYPDIFKWNADTFGAVDGKPASPTIRVFEYYLDGILFKVVVPPLLRVMQDDLAFYAANGSHTVGALMTGTGPFIAPNINAYAFARLTWDPEQSLEELRTAFARGTTGNVAHLPKYFKTIEDAFAQVLDLDPREVKLTARTTIDALVDDPPADIGDPIHAPDDLISHKLSKMRRALTFMQSAGALLREVEIEKGWPSPAPFFDEEEVFSDWFTIGQMRLELEQARRAPKRDVDKLRKWVEAARFLINELIESPGIGKMDERYVANGQILLQLFWGLRLDKIEQELITEPASTLKRRSERIEDAKALFAKAGSLWDE